MSSSAPVPAALEPAAPTTIQSAVNDAVQTVIQPAVLNRPAAANYIGVKPAFLAELTATGEVPSLKIGRRRLYRIRALDAYLEAKEAS
jgi:excisionase family DNA binding protein